MDGMSALLIVGVPVGIALVLHLALVTRVRKMLALTGGAVRTAQDLEQVRAVINQSMQLAIVYLGMYLAYLAFLAWRVAAGTDFLAAVGYLFWFGVLTLPLGLLTRKYEKKVQSMDLGAADPALQETYQRWLVQWKQPRLRLPD